MFLASSGSSVFLRLLDRYAQIVTSAVNVIRLDKLCCKLSNKNSINPQMVCHEMVKGRPCSINGNLLHIIKRN